MSAGCFKRLGNRLAIFALYGCFQNTFLSQFQSNLLRFAKVWRKRFVSSEERRNYIAAEWQKILFVTIWVCANIGLFIEACYRWHKKVASVAAAHQFDPNWAGYHPWYVMIARGFGQLLNFNCALILVPTMRTVLNVLRSLKFGTIVPLDKNLIFHRHLAYWIAICTAGHTLAHYLNYSCCYRMYATQKGASEKSAWTAAWGNKFGLTGNILTIIMVVMYGAATASYRRSQNFTVFWYTHHLFLLFFCGLLIHGKNFWMWFLGPGCLYIAERFLRNVRGSSETTLKRVTVLPSMVVHLELDKPAFAYESGQYCFINCPAISQHEWHPFTISSAPEQENLAFHIRCAGDWTEKLREMFVADEKSGVVKEPKDQFGDDIIIRVDGPFGTCAEYVYNFEYIMLVAAGIGVTPYVSLLKHFKHMLDNPSKHSRQLRVKKCFFYWINRDKGSWEWFSDMLDELESSYPDFFQINTYMTGNLKLDEIKQIVSSSIEVRTFSPQSPASPSSAKLLARASYDYSPQSSDEIRLNTGDEIEVTERDPSGWWTGKNLYTGQTGFFPADYVVFIDSVTHLKDSKNRHFGRPNWKDEFGKVRTLLESTIPNINELKLRPQVGIFICGPSMLSKQLYQTSMQESKRSTVLFKFHKENF